MAEETRQMELTAAEQEVVEHLRMTPAERQAEAETRRQERLNALPPEQKQVEEARAARIDAMTASQRRAYLAGQRLVAVARALRRDAQQGAALSTTIAAVEPAQAEDLNWLVAELKKAK